jgi:hypothetical protein
MDENEATQAILEQNASRALDECYHWGVLGVQTINTSTFAVKW